jgi:hypothetical protein
MNWAADVQEDSPGSLGDRSGMTLSFGGGALEVMLGSPFQVRI